MVGSRWIGSAIACLPVAMGLIGCNTPTRSAPTLPTPTPVTPLTPVRTRTCPPQPGGPAPYVHHDVTLSGVVTEPENTPVEGVMVYCDVCGALNSGGHTFSYTDAQGVYSFTGVAVLPGVPTTILVEKAGYSLAGECGLDELNVTVNVDRDTRYDIHVVRR